MWKLEQIFIIANSPNPSILISYSTFLSILSWKEWPYKKQRPSVNWVQKWNHFLLFFSAFLQWEYSTLSMKITIFITQVNFYFSRFHMSRYSFSPGTHSRGNETGIPGLGTPSYNYSRAKAWGMSCDRWDWSENPLAVPGLKTFEFGSPWDQNLCPPRSRPIPSLVFHSEILTKPDLGGPSGGKKVQRNFLKDKDRLKQLFGISHQNICTEFYPRICWTKNKKTYVLYISNSCFESFNCSVRLCIRRLCWSRSLWTSSIIMFFTKQFLS